MEPPTPDAAETAAWFRSTLPGRPEVRPVRTQRRAHADLHVLEIDHAAGALRAVAKVPRRGSGTDPSRQRPGLVPAVPAERHFAFEAEAAERMYGVLAPVPDVMAPQVLAVRPEPPTLVLELLEPADMLSGVLGRAVITPGRRRLDAAVRASDLSGRAAQHLVASGPVPGRPTRHVDPRELIAAARALAAFLERPTGGASLRALDCIESLLADVDVLPATGGHGDFAPRNLLVVPSGVAVIDALFAHNVSIHEDMARWVVNTMGAMAEIPRPGGVAGPAEAVVDAFLRSAGRSLRDARFRALCLLVALDRWAAILGRRPSDLRRKVRGAGGRRAMPWVVEWLAAER